MLFVLIVGAGAFMLNERARKASIIQRDAVTELALKQAKESLIAYATAHTVLDPDTPNGPGYFPCPDKDDDGVADWNCGNFSGTSAQTRRLGRLPWKTLKMPDLRDSSGERLWYAVSSVYKNSSLKPGLNPDTGMGTITVRDSTGNVIHDGTLGDGVGDIYKAQSGGAVAIIIAPGAPLTRRETADGTATTIQDRGCSGSCDSGDKCVTSPEELTPKCNPINYLDKAAGQPFADEDNADFVDVNVDRRGNTNGFIQGPVHNAARELLVNDRIIVVTYDDIVQAMMKRVAVEAYHCLVEFTNNPVDANSPLNLGRYPFAAPVCRSGYNNANQWADGKGVLFGRFPAAMFTSTGIVSNGLMQSAWTANTAHACTIGTAKSFSPWFESWKDHVFFAAAFDHQPAARLAPECSSGNCLDMVDQAGNIIAQNKQFAVLVAGPPLITAAGMQDRATTGKRSIGNYLEATNTLLESMNDFSAIPECSDMTTQLLHSKACSPACNRITVAPKSDSFNDLVLFYPP